MRGGHLRRVELDERLVISVERSEEMLALDEALNRLAEVNPRQPGSWSYDTSAGLSVEQIATALAIACDR
jgi:hypothetical protein